jgi:hypothetical protein
MNTKNLGLRIVFIIVPLLTLLACSIATRLQNVKVGAKEVLNVAEAAPQDQAETRVTIGMGAGKLTISGGAEKLVEGQISYNVALLKPTLQSGDHSLTLLQSADLHGIPGRDLINDWNLKLGKTPINLTINAGAYDGKVDLGGVSLTKLSINDGASNVRVSFTEPNPGKMSLLEYHTGASNIELTGLGNANFEAMRFEGGAGNFTLDFSGRLQRDGTVKVTGGVNHIVIIIPTGTQAIITTSTPVGNVNTDGTWTVHNHVYQSEGSGPKLTIEVENGVGSLDLRRK